MSGNFTGPDLWTGLNVDKPNQQRGLRTKETLLVECPRSVDKVTERGYFFYGSGY